MSVQELIKKKDKSEEEQTFMYWFDRLSPISDNDSTMNKICHRLEEELDDLSYHVRSDEFDKSILMTDKSIKRALVPEILKVYEEYKSESYAHMKTGGNDDEDRAMLQRMFDGRYKEKIYSICNNEEDLVNILVNELYNTPNSKQFIWAMCGDYLVEKLLKDNDNTIKYPTENPNGDIEWNGIRYSIIEERIDE